MKMVTVDQILCFHRFEEKLAKLPTSLKELDILIIFSIPLPNLVIATMQNLSTDSKYWIKTIIKRVAVKMFIRLHCLRVIYH